jgi:hypothetical protein
MRDGSPTHPKGHHGAPIARSASIGQRPSASVRSGRRRPEPQWPGRPSAAGFCRPTGGPTLGAPGFAPATQTVHQTVVARNPPAAVCGLGLHGPTRNRHRRLLLFARPGGQSIWDGRTRPDSFDTVPEGAALTSEECSIFGGPAGVSALRNT